MHPHHPHRRGASRRLSVDSGCGPSLRMARRSSSQLCCARHRSSQTGSPGMQRSCPARSPVTSALNASAHRVIELQCPVRSEDWEVEHFRRPNRRVKYGVPLSLDRAWLRKTQSPVARIYLMTDLAQPHAAFAREGFALLLGECVERCVVGSARNAINWSPR